MRDKEIEEASNEMLKMKKKNLKTQEKYGLVLVLLILLFLVVGILFSYNPQPKGIEPFEECCDDTFLGVCFDKESEFYTCNLKTEVCSQEDWVRTNLLKYMLVNDVKIYGSYTCGWCVKQINEFGDYKGFLIDFGLFVDCKDPLNRKICKGIESTPTWKKGDEIINLGYIPINKIEVK